MSAFRYSMIFQYASGNDSSPVPSLQAGWSESVYLGSFSDTTKAAFKVLAQKRAALLPQKSSITGLRIQAVDPSGQANSFPVNYPGSTSCDIPQMALLLRVGGQSVTNVRSMRLAAIPDSQVLLGQFNPGFVYKLALNSYLEELSKWSFRASDATQASYNLTQIASDGTYTLSQAYSPGINSFVKIRGLKNADDDSVKGGVFKVISVASPTSGKLADWKHSETTFLGKLTPYLPIYPQIVAGPSSVSRVVVRKVGRPTAGYRGRR